MKRGLLFVLISIISFSSLSSASTISHMFTAGYGSEFTLEVTVDNIQTEQQVIYNVTMKLQIDKFGSSVSKINQVRLYAKILGETYQTTSYKQGEEDILKSPGSSKSVNASFLFDITNVTEEVIIYSAASLNEYLFEDTFKTTCTVWFNEQTITMEPTMETSYIGYLTIVFAISLLIIVRFHKKEKKRR
ncbi:MAG: hypothetical protein HGN29_13455 [Asgard group archaeon]|nr:hypothetical protein [Asgard group archaeon]